MRLAANARLPRRMAAAPLWRCWWLPALARPRTRRLPCQILAREHRRGRAARRANPGHSPGHERRGFNPQAPAVSGARQPGGLFINWRGTWAATRRAQPPTRTSRKSACPISRRTAHRAMIRSPTSPTSSIFTPTRPSTPMTGNSRPDVARMEPIVQQEYANEGYYRCWVLLSAPRSRQPAARPGLECPGHSLRGLASTSITTTARRVRSPTRGMATSTGPTTRPSAARCSSTPPAGARRGVGQRWQLDAHPPHKAGAESRHAFVPTADVVGSARDTVVQSQLTIGEEAQLLNSFLDAYDLTANKSYLDAVLEAVNSLYSPAIGLWDQANDGFFFSVDADGQSLNTHYKESRQAWMLPLLQHLARIEGGGVWTAREQTMLTVVRDKLWQPSINGYPYREIPGFTGVTSPTTGPAARTSQEDWVTSKQWASPGKPGFSAGAIELVTLKNIRHGVRILLIWAIPGPGAIYTGEGTNGHDFASYRTFLCPRACRA